MPRTSPPSATTPSRPAPPLKALLTGSANEDHALFEEQVLRKRPYLRRNWCVAVLEQPIRRELQSDGRIRYWGRVSTEDGEQRILRVVTLSDGETVHNAFFDRGFRPEED